MPPESAFTYGLINSRTSQVIDFAPWHDYQRWLAAGEREVVVPFARTLASMIPARAVRLRRDLGQLIRAIKAHALLHRGHRNRDKEGAILATIDQDYRAVSELMSDILAASAEVKLAAPMAETIAAVKQVQPASPETGASVRSVMEVLRLDRSAAYRRLRAAEEAGYIVNVEQRRGRSGQYRKEGRRSRAIELLPTSDDLREAVRIARARGRRRN